MKKKPARQPRRIEVVVDSPVATKAAKAEPKAKAVKAKAEPKTKAEPKAKSTKAKPVPTDATPAPVEPPTPSPEPNATVAKSGAKKGKGKAEAAPSERKPEQSSTVARVEGKLTGKLSAIDAAAKVSETGGPLNCKELIDAMSAAGLWTSPGGKTPHATLYSAILREITTKGDESRFVKTERGRFARK